ncbi:hypothetical protein SUGI_0804000 [Cryptomeria japonica]|uniref:zinc transporter 8 n=1 Tax=Cryptomeria japonica TaxID=3369 RepID=UPI0024146944|nr:zinc transporter 8 [Cryptomeria japonica]GLJ39372.1 hypothetical protein SUGI_0804000 [Cryptomeria japonica]
METFRRIAFSLALFSTLSLVGAEDADCSEEQSFRNKNEALHLKLGAIASILVGGTIGVCLPIWGKTISALRPDKDIFLIIKSFAAGVIVATGFVHILPDAFESLGNPCLKGDAWEKFPFAGFTAMMGSVVSLMVDAMATGYYQRDHLKKHQSTVGVPLADMSSSQVENIGQVELQSHLHTHGGTLAYDSTAEGSASSLLRHRVISQVLELGIVTHSVIIGISLGASENPSTIRPLIAALTFHQFFEGMGLGGCIVQARFKSRSTALMAFFFSITTPFGIAVGIAISSTYNENSPTALIVEGMFNSVSAGILIYMALVDLLAADFLGPRMQSKVGLQLWSYASLFLGIGAMSLMAKWA